MLPALPSAWGLCESQVCVLGTILSLLHLASKFGSYQPDKPATFHHQSSLPKEDDHLLLPRSTGVLPLLAPPGTVLCLPMPTASPCHPPLGTLCSGSAYAPLLSCFPPAPQSQAFPLHSFNRHSAKGTFISIRDVLPRDRTWFKWSKEI